MTKANFSNLKKGPPFCTPGGLLLSMWYLRRYLL